MYSVKKSILICGSFLIFLSASACSAEKDSTLSAPPVYEETADFLHNTDEINRKAESVFVVEALDENGSRISAGSGFLMFEGDILVTSAHVVTNAKTLRVCSQEGIYINSLRILAVDEESDTAIFQLEKEAGMPLVPEKNTEKAEPVLAVGSSEGMVNLITEGRLSGYNETGNIRWIAFSAPVSLGESGGALFNNQGKVIGLIVGSVKNADCLNLASPIIHAVELYEKGK